MSEGTIFLGTIDKQEHNIVLRINTQKTSWENGFLTRNSQYPVAMEEVAIQRLQNREE